MNGSEQNPLADALRRGELTAEQKLELEAHLAGRPEERAAWEEEIALTHLLAQLPQAPVSTNFTARVMHAARAQSQEGHQRASGPQSFRFWRNWMLKLAPTAAVVCIGLYSYQHHQATVARRELAENLAKLSKLANQAPLELLVNFDAIERLNQLPPDADDKLIDALQK